MSKNIKAIVSKSYEYYIPAQSHRFATVKFKSIGILRCPFHQTVH